MRGRVRLIALPLAVAALALTAALAQAQPGDPGPDPSGPNGQSHKDGCTREPAQLIDGASPEWTYVFDDTTQPAPPAPRRVIGTVASGDPQGEAVHPSGDDLPSGHDDYDLNVNVYPDPPYVNLLAGHNDPDPTKRTGNFAGTGEAVGAVHSELEGDVIPSALWPQAGDRIDLTGNWVWDCGHWGVPTNVFSPDYVLPKPCPTGVLTCPSLCLGSLVNLPPVFDPSQCTITGESTEFHPWRAMWDIRKQANSPEGEAQGLLYVSTDATRAGLVETCAHQNPPIANTANPLMKLCVQNGTEWQDATGDYSYFLPAPPRPSFNAHLTYRAVDLGSSGAPPPTLTPEDGGVRVTFHLATAPGQDLKMYYHVFAGWDDLPLPAVPTHLRVSFDKLDVHRAQDPGCTPTKVIPGCQNESLSTNQLTFSPGEWNLFYDAQGVWGQVSGGEFDVADNTSLTLNQSVDLYVPPGQGWRLLTLGRECDLQALATATGPTGKLKSCPGTVTPQDPTNPLEVADSNDVPGKVVDQWQSAAASLGTHTADAKTHTNGDPTSTCPPDPNPHGCYTLTYTVSEINDAAGRVRLPAFANSLPNTLMAAPSPASMAAIGVALVVALLILALLPGTGRRQR